MPDIRVRKGPSGKNVNLFEAGPWDYIIATRDELAAIVQPVGNEFVLPGDRSYLFRAPVPLIGERVRVSNPNILLQGLAPGDGLDVDSAGSALLIDAAVPLTLRGMTVNNDNASGDAVNTSGVVEASGCQFTCASNTQETITFTDGSWVGRSNVITGPAFRAADHVAGDWEEDGSFIDSLTTTINNQVTAGTLKFSRTTLLAGQNGARLRGARAEFNDCFISVGIDNAAALAALGVDELVLNGGVVTGDAAGSIRSGIHYAAGGNVLTQITGTLFKQLNFGVRHTDGAGSYGAFCAGNVVLETDVDVGISWTNSLIPAGGLSYIGGAIRGATPFQNFVQSDARVNIKGVVGAAGQIVETGIIV